MQILDQAIEATRTYKPMTKEEVAALLARTRTDALNGRFECTKRQVTLTARPIIRNGSAETA